MNDERLLPLLERYAATRDTAVRDQLVEGYLPLARAVARKFAGRGVEMEDLEQVASIALLKAIDRFEPDRGFRFVTYAVPTITGDLRNHLRDHGGLMRMPRDMRTRLYQMTKEQEEALLKTILGHMEYWEGRIPQFDSVAKLVEFLLS